MQVKNVMQSPVVTIAAETPLTEALAIMDQCGINHLPVLQNQVLCGLLTRQALAIVQHTHTSVYPPRVQTCHPQSLRVLDVMQRRVITQSPQAPAHEAARLVWEQGVPCIVVVREGTPVDIVSRRNC
jgi:acetoin utilization protein AcuB